MKRCLQCGETKPKEAFYKRARSWDGLQVWCKACKRAYQREYCQSEAGVTAIWRANHSEAAKTAHARYNRSPLGRAAQKRCRQSEAGKAAQRRYDTSRKGRALRKRFDASAKGRAGQRRAQAIRRAVLESDESTLTAIEWQDHCTEHTHCPYCGVLFIDAPTMDHVIPLSRGGVHTKDNVLPVCETCNKSKGNKPLEEWLSEQTP